MKESENKECSNPSEKLSNIQNKEEIEEENNKKIENNSNQIQPLKLNEFKAKIPNKIQGGIPPKKFEVHKGKVDILVPMKKIEFKKMVMPSF